LLFTKHQEHIKYFLLFFSPLLILQLFNLTRLVTNDDFGLWQMIIDGESRTFILSYPLSYTLVCLYEAFPNIPWFSFVLLVGMLLNIWFMAKYCSTYVRHYKTLVVVFFFVVLILYSLNLSITLITVSLIATSLLYIRNDFKIFIFLITLTTFLRNDFMLTLLPVILLSILLFYNFSISKRNILYLFVFFLIALMNINLYKTDQEYSEWMTFNKARANFADLGIHPNYQNESLTTEQKKLLEYGWYMQDETILPTSIIIKLSNASFIDVLKSIQYNFNHNLILSLIFLGFLYAGFYRKKYFIYYLSLFLFVFIILVVRDVERTSIPLLIALLCIIIESLQIIERPEDNFSFLLIIPISIFLLKIPNMIQTNYLIINEKNHLQNELIQLVENSDKTYIISIGFPSQFRYLNTIFLGNTLFNETNWIKFNKHNILMTGWLSRHPYFYRTHKISSFETKRKYDDYYGFLLSESTTFIGDKSQTNIQSELSKTILTVYDQIHNQAKECSHKIIVTDTSPHFEVSKIINQCKKEKNDPF